MAQRAKRASSARRLLWFAGLWCAGVGVTAGVAYGLRLWLGAA